MTKEKRLKFMGYGIDEDIEYRIFNKKDEFLGTIEKCRVGAYMHWCFCPKPNMQFSAGCMDEIRQFMKNPNNYYTE